MRKARKAILLCHEAAREQEGDPVAMASAKAIAHAASTLYLGRHAMRVAFYGLTALRYLEKPAEPRPFIKKRMRQAP